MEIAKDVQDVEQIKCLISVSKAETRAVVGYAPVQDFEQ
jgi:hypothetical protein